jgi:hypothetical protein
MAKRNEGKSEVVTKLPGNAILVKEYAEQEHVKEPAIYNRYARAIADNKPLPFKIVIYIERNFVIPN